MKLVPDPSYENETRIQRLVESGQFDKAREVYEQYQRQDPEGADRVHAAIQFSYGIAL